MPLSMADGQFDETSCSPLCQHPQCWASNRRVERGLPRFDVFAADRNEKTSKEYGGLPTLKVHNILDDYGFCSADLYPSPYQQATTPIVTDASGVCSRQRSASAPSTKDARKSSKSRSSRRERHPSSRPPLLEPIQQPYPPRLAKVHLDQVCGPLAQQTEGHIGQMVYIWQPSEKALRSTEPPPGNRTESKPTLVSPRDITGDLIPADIAERVQSQKKMKSKQTPTGGRPYTHPLKSPPPIARRTLPADMDDGIAQLLSLPRDVILEILKHTNESDLFDRDKVQVLLERVMPQVRFNDSKMLTPDPNARSPPLHAMGLLRNKKMPILDGRRKFEKAEVPPQSLPKLPLVLDVSEVARSYLGGGDERQRQRTYPEMTGVLPDVGHLLRNKVTSVSAKSLPPLLPGSTVTKPFHYTIQSLDLALTPLRTPENPPSSPRSENASTLYATVASESSDDHTLQSTAKHPHLAVMRQESPASSHHSHGTVNRVPSYSSYKGPYNPSPVPYGSPGPFNTPHGTPLSYSSPGATSGQDTKEKGPPTRLGSGSTSVSRGTLQTIHECPASSLDTVVAAPSSSLKQPRSVSPWENPGRQQSRTLSTPTNPSPEVWPAVDEKSYLHSPENLGVPTGDKPETDVPETVAPPPSPAPSVRSGILDDDVASTDGSVIQRVVECNQSVASDGAERVTSITSEDSKENVDEMKKRVLSAIREDDTVRESQESGHDETPDGHKKLTPAKENSDRGGLDGEELEGTKGEAEVAQDEKLYLVESENDVISDAEEVNAIPGDGRKSNQDQSRDGNLPGTRFNSVEGGKSAEGRVSECEEGEGPSEKWTKASEEMYENLAHLTTTVDEEVATRSNLLGGSASADPGCEETLPISQGQGRASPVPPKTESSELTA